jgi:hypothetical protein
MLSGTGTTLFWLRSMSAGVIAYTAVIPMTTLTIAMAGPVRNRFFMANSRMMRLRRQAREHNSTFDRLEALASVGATAYTAPGFSCPNPAFREFS